MKKAIAIASLVERVPAVKPDPAYFPPGESTMGGSWRSGGAMWRPTGGG
jgi:hypothetical protein